MATGGCLKIHSQSDIDFVFIDSLPRSPAAMLKYRQLSATIQQPAVDCSTPWQELRSGKMVEEGGKYQVRERGHGRWKWGKSEEH